MTPGADGIFLDLALDVSAVPKRPAGAGRYTVELARALSARGDCGLALLARRDDSARWGETSPRQRVVAVAPSSRVTRLFYEQFRFASVVAGLSSPPVDAHHGPHYTMPRRSRLPCVVTVHDMTFFDHPEWHEPSKVVWFRRTTRYAVAHAALIVCVSETTAKRLREVLSPPCPVLAVPHGVDHARFTPLEPAPRADREVRDRLGLDRPYLLHLGTLEPRKGIVDLVAAFDMVAGEHPDLELVLAGGAGWKAEPALEAISTARAGERIRRLGYVGDEDVPALLRRAKAVAYPSLEEGFGLPALEALACGAPLVTTAGTSMAELAGDSRAPRPRARSAQRSPRRLRRRSQARARQAVRASRAGSFGRRLVHLAILCRGAYGGVPHGCRDLSGPVVCLNGERRGGPGPISLSPVRAYLTGGTGFVGAWMLRHLSETGDTAVAPGPDVDVTDLALLAADLQAALPDVVYHLAALTHVGRSWSEPAETFRVNALGTLNLLEAAARLRGSSNRRARQLGGGLRPGKRREAT